MSIIDDARRAHKQATAELDKTSLRTNAPAFYAALAKMKDAKAYLDRVEADDKAAKSERRDEIRHEANDRSLRRFFRFRRAYIKSRNGADRLDMWDAQQLLSMGDSGQVKAEGLDYHSTCAAYPAIKPEDI